MKHKNCEDEEVTIDTICDKKTRKIFITGEIDLLTYQNVVLAIEYLDRTKGNINLVINSTGGDVSSGFGIINAIKSTRNKVIAHCVGECMSIGMAIVCSCDFRFSYPYTRFMIHEIKVNIPDGYTFLTEVRRHIKEAERVNETMYDILSQGSSLTKNEVKQLCLKETFMSLEQAAGYGFIDEIHTFKKKRKET